VFKGVGYSGKPPYGKNNPAAEDQHNIGPIPVGKYLVGSPVDTITHGPYVLPLTPDPGNVMYGRSGFLVHGDSVVHEGFASEGCIVLDRAAREKIWKSGDHVITVIHRYEAPKVEESK
jgi:hypothetical protein